MLVLLVVMFVNGIARVLVLQPRFGEEAARQVACVTGMALILAVTAFFVWKLRSASRAQLLSIGSLWLVFTIAFEFGFGRFVSGLSWDALLADYNLLEGRLWPLVLLTTFFAPWLLGFVRRASHSWRWTEQGPTANARRA